MASSAWVLILVQGPGCSGRIDLGPISDGNPGPSDASFYGSDTSPSQDGSNGNSTLPPPDEDVAPPPDSQADASIAMTDGPAFKFDPVAPGLAGFGFLVNDVVQRPMACPSDNWEFSASTTPSSSCGIPPPCDAGVNDVYLVNTGQSPLAYIAAGLWNGTGYVPGVATGDPYQLVGVLDAGARVDITSVYDGGTVALLGSSAPFSSPDAGKYESDEGSIPWPAGVAGSEGSATMWLAQIEVRPSCGVANKVW
jgi:hypothetical protein